MNEFLRGVGYFVAGFGLLAKPGLKRYMLIPLIINIAFFTALFFAFKYLTGEFNAWFTQYLPAWLHWFAAIIWVLFFLSFFVVFIYFFVTVANIVAAPFNSFLAEKVEFVLTGYVAEGRSLKQNIRDIPRILGRQFSILAYYLPRALLIIILFFIPVAQAVAPAIWFLFSAWFMALTYLDYPTDNHQIPVETVQSWLAERRFLGLGFGLIVLISAMVPIINFFTIPAAVAGASKLWVEENPSVKLIKD